MNYIENNVFEEGLKRIRMLFDYHDDVIVSISGGKDSTVLFEMALMVAKERNRLPLKVYWLDQEAEWQATVDYIDYIMRLPEVKPYWFQIPFDFTNSLSAEHNFLRVWDENKKEKWIHPKVDISIKENPTNINRFHKLVQQLPEYCTDSNNCAVLIGMRIDESPRRRVTITDNGAFFRGETWCRKKQGKTQTFYPIYDFTFSDIWTAIAKNNWKYNTIYDLEYRYGFPTTRMRVSALIHETAWYSIEMLQEAEPKTYNRFVSRVEGVNTFSHIFSNEDSLVPKMLPFAFKDWKEYRDYLLEKITKPEYKELFRKRWQGQDGEEFYKIHVKELIINDIDGTVNANYVDKIRLRERNKKKKKQFEELIKSEDLND